MSFILLCPLKRLTFALKKLVIQIVFTTVNITKHSIYFIMSVIDRFSAFYRDLKTSQLSEIAEIYCQDVVLVDPIGKHEGLNLVTAYFEKLLAGAKHCDFSITSLCKHELARAHDTETYSVNWVMSFATPKLNKGQTIDVDGMTLLKVKNDRIFFHQDYYDLGQMVYEHVPILGAITRKIKKGMRA